MKLKRRGMALVLAFLVVFSCAGCAAAGAETLYALPRLSDEYVQLEELINQRVREGGEYAAPVGGNNRQSVQLHDLDGDGTEEAIAFLADETHTPNVCVYRRDGEGAYYLFVAIEGAGSAVNSVEYADLNGDGAAELIISWQISGDIRLLSVYSLGQEVQTQLLSADCSEFTVCDLDGDGAQELLDLSVDYGGVSTMTRYVFGADSSVNESYARISDGVTEVLRVRTGYLSDGTSALFVESRWGGEDLITDVFIVSGGEIANITMSGGGRSNTLRAGDAYAADINGDRALEIPDSAGDILNWYALDSSGRRNLVVSTYHDYDGSWYLVLPEEMLSGRMTVTKRSDVVGETAVTFAVDEPLLTVYTLSGENRLDRAREEGRFVLGEYGAEIYAGELLTDTLSQEEITQNFNLIYPEWQTGELG